jgi:MFS superfamily sulfate permease-like transporter
VARRRGIALMSFTETIACGRAFAAPGEGRPDSNQELVAIGAGNVIGGLFGAMPSGGGASQTALNRNTGARTQAAELVTAAMAVATMLFLAPVLGPMPNATLAAIVIAYSIGLISPRDIEAIRRVRTIEFRWVIAACVGVMVLGTLKGILVAVLLSMASLLSQANNPPLHVLGGSAAPMCFARARPSIRRTRHGPGLPSRAPRAACISGTPP